MRTVRVLAVAVAATGVLAGASGWLGWTVASVLAVAVLLLLSGALWRIARRLDGRSGAAPLPDWALPSGQVSRTWSVIDAVREHQVLRQRQRVHDGE
jgi:hypothetical protein